MLRSVCSICIGYCRRGGPPALRHRQCTKGAPKGLTVLQGGSEGDPGGALRRGPKVPEDAFRGSEGNLEDNFRRGPEGFEGIPKASEGALEGPKGWFRRCPPRGPCRPPEGGPPKGPRNHQQRRGKGGPGSPPGWTKSRRVYHALRAIRRLEKTPATPMVVVPL